jgi:RNA polymerase sigma-70 factor, ECF subfamily
MLGNSGTAFGLPDEFFPTRYETLRRWLRRRIGADRTFYEDGADQTGSTSAPSDVQYFLTTICDYAVQRQDTSKTGSVLLLRVFWAYTRSDIATLARSSALRVHEWLQVAGRELNEYLTQPRSHDLPLDWRAGLEPGSSDTWLQDLRSALAPPRAERCPPVEWYRAQYDCGDELDCQTLGHLSRCSPCQQVVAADLGIRARIRGQRADRHAIRATVEEHFLAHWQSVYRYLRCTQSATDAEEITQEAFLRLHRVLVEGEHIRDVPRWLFTVARRLATDRLRRHERPLLVELSRNLADTLPDDGTSCEEEYHERQRRAALTRALNDLTQLQRECLHLRSEGYSLREISDRVGVSVCGASDAVGRAVRRLRKHLNESD